MTRERDCDKWFVLWYEDKQAMLGTMHRNMSADLEAGYDPMGNSIRKQIEEIRKYAEDIDETMQKFRDMTTEKVNHWCYIDLLRRGAI